MAGTEEVKFVFSMDDMFSKQARQAEGAGNKLDNTMKLLGATAAAIFSGGAIMSFANDIKDSLSKAELFQASLTTLLMGNKNEAAALQSQLISLAKTTPFQLEDVQASTKQLLAYGFEAGKITDNIRMLGDVAAGVGQPISEIVYLYGTLRTQGRAFAKDIYQFTGRGIPIVRELAKQFKVTESAVMGLVEKGKVGFKEIETAFSNMTTAGGQFFNMMEAQSKTVGGQISNMEDSWEQLKVNIGKSQHGIIANTISWASTMVETMNTYFAQSNFRESATSGINKDRQLNSHFTFGDERKDRLFAAYKGNFKGGSRKYFETELERDEFLKSFGGMQYSSGETIGTQERFNKFSNRFYDQLNKVSATPGGKYGQNQLTAIASFISEIRKEHSETLKLLTQGRISSKLAENEFAILHDVLNKTKGLQDLNKSKSNPSKEDAAKKEAEKTKTPHYTQINIHIEQMNGINKYEAKVGTEAEAGNITGEQIVRLMVTAVENAQIIAGI